MSSIDNETLSKIDTQAASSAAVESSPLSPHHQEEKERLERLLQNRSEAKELEDKNILKPGNVAPSLQAARAELEKRKLEDKLEGRLERRPEKEDLERRGILKDQTVAPALQGKLTELERSQMADKLGKEFASRPDVDELKAKGILKGE
ncbi:RPEL repeat protein [Acaromyces ingoldii]|uniref:RPEL repeat protein n=1 Tax=Acaromyces ingoldii TaxID=215250 RepID=A0A316YNS1_9BASI|nr:RPEL repeat protein [Acaromyces ingoldii]PWN90676.1 RPEL repeat protein [Acaromyces ingoldii]